MKRYFRGFIILFLVLLSLGNVNAQSDSAYLKHSIKTNLFQWWMNEANITYEYRFSKKFGLEGTIGTYGIYNRSMSIPFGGEEPLPQKGVVVRVNPKLYFGYGNFKRSIYYFSPMLLFKSNVADGCFCSMNEDLEKEEKRLIIGTSALLGYQSVIGRRLIFDFYVGGGIRYRNINSLVRSYETSWGGQMIDPNLPRTRTTREEWQPSVHLGMKFGFGFPVLSKKIITVEKAEKIKPYYRYTINTQPFKYLNLWQEQNLGFEYRFSRKIGLEATIGGYFIKGKTKLRDIDGTIDNKYAFYLRPKIYFESPVESINIPFYISPMFVYKLQNRSSVNDVTKERFTGPSLLAGYQANAGNFILDIYTGFGMQNYHENITSLLVNYPYNRTYKGWQPVFHLGAKVGFGFKASHKYIKPEHEKKTEVYYYDTNAYFKYIIKTNVFHDIVNTPNISFEYRFNRTYGLEASVGGSLNNKANSLDQKNIFYLRLNPRLYTPSPFPGLKKPLYISPMAIMKNYNENSYYKYATYKTYALGLLTGVQLAVYKHLIADMNTGLGLKYQDINSTDTFFPNSPTHAHFHEWATNYYVSLKIGYGFKPKK